MARTLELGQRQAVVVSNGPSGGSWQMTRRFLDDKATMAAGEAKTRARAISHVVVADRALLKRP